MISKTLVNAVVKEAAKLREHATDEELNRINLARLFPTSSEHCIYGQATGDCFSKRASELIYKCSAKLFDPNSLRNANCQLRTVAKRAVKTRNRFAGVYSPIEVYISQMGADNAQLIRYLKGKTDVLDLTATINC